MNSEDARGGLVFCVLLSDSIRSVESRKLALMRSLGYLSSLLGRLVFSLSMLKRE